MHRADMARRVEAARVGRLSTRSVLVPFCFAVDFTSDGDLMWTAIDGKPKSTLALQRLHDIGVDPAVTVLVDHYEEDWTRLWWVRLRGTAAVAASDDARTRGLGLLAAKYPQYVTAPPPGPVIRIELHAWRGWAWGTPSP